MDSLTMRQTQVQVRVNSFVRSVYNWMAIGLALTGFTAYAVANMPEVRSVIFGSGIVFFGLIIAQLALVFIISSRIYRMQAGTATALFIVYSVLNGATLSSIFLAYAKSTITSTFFVCSATFVACSIYGWTTRRDLTSMGAQDIKNMALAQPHDIDAGAVRKGAILGALKLYLDFINLFLMLLRIFGGSRDE